jgi:hypothetical protein
MLEIITPSLGDKVGRVFSPEWLWLGAMVWLTGDDSPGRLFYQSEVNGDQTEINEQAYDIV